MMPDNEIRRWQSPSNSRRKPMPVRGMTVLDFLGKHYRVFLAILITLWLSVVASWSWFVYQHGRLPLGSGELVNWMLGLSQ
jgi:hypothetical protein